jgi:predicted DNA-binding transcriptional regulator AlpA
MQYVANACGTRNNDSRLGHDRCRARSGPQARADHSALMQSRSGNVSSLLDRPTVCRLFGGTRPIDPATLYRGIASGRFPAPVKIGPGMSRWLRSECGSRTEAPYRRTRCRSSRRCLKTKTARRLTNRGGPFAHRRSRAVRQPSTRDLLSHKARMRVQLPSTPPPSPARLLSG